MIRSQFVRRAGSALAVSVFLLCPALALADAGVKVSNVWARSTAPGQNVAGAYLDIVANAPAALVRAESPAARLVELHEMKIEGDIMKMRAVPKIDLPAGKEVKLEPGGLHLMLIDIKQPLKVGEKVPLTLVFDAGGKSEKLTVDAEVRDAKGSNHRH
jgi:copper(I)-binding protein